MISMILDSISIWDDCILPSATDYKDDVQVLELLRWLRMGGLVSRLRDRLVLGVRKLLVEAYSGISSCGLSVI